VIDAFYAGLETVNLQDFDFVCKFDLDLEIPEVYFEELMMRMEAEPRLGTCSGKPYYPDPESGELISEKCGDEMSVGMTKFYRVSCFEEIGGFVREVMWDGIDCHTCRMKGWIACSWDDEQIRFLHLRAMGSSQKSIWTGRMRHGFGQYFMGTGLIYMTVSAVYRMTRPPLILGGLAMWWGYVRSALMRNPTPRPNYTTESETHDVRPPNLSSYLAPAIAGVRDDCVHPPQPGGRAVWNPGGVAPPDRSLRFWPQAGDA
jgi:hypothetical protein